MYRVDLETGAITLEATNPGDVLTWTTDNDFVIRAATAFDGKTGRFHRARARRGRQALARSGRHAVRARAFCRCRSFVGSLIAGFAPDGKSLSFDSALHSDKGQTGAAWICATGDELGVVARRSAIGCGICPSGLGNGAERLRRPGDGRDRRRSNSITLTPHWVFLDPKLEADFESINHEVPGFMRSRSVVTVADRQWIIAARRSDAPAAYYTFDRDDEKTEASFTTNIPRLSKLHARRQKAARHQDARRY